MNGSSLFTKNHDDDEHNNGGNSKSGIEIVWCVDKLTV